MITHIHTRSKQGFTLLEMMISMSLMMLVFWVFTMFSFGASNAYREAQVSEMLAIQANRALDFIVEELNYAERSGIPNSDPIAGDSTVTYHRCTGATGRVLQWGNMNSISLQLEQGEIDDGLDNNSNGLIDERTLAWTEDLGLATQRQVLKAHWIREFLEGEIPNGLDDNGNGLIDERGLTIQTDGKILNIQLTLEAPDHSGRLITKTVRTAVRIRN